MELSRWLGAVSKIFLNGVARTLFDVTLDPDNCRTASDSVLKLFGSSITVAGGAPVEGRARPPPYKGHEHFGFQDGISQPAARSVWT